MAEQNLTNAEIVDHFQYSGESHLINIMNRAIDVKEQRLTEQLSYLSGEEMEQLMDKVNVKRPDQPKLNWTSLIKDVTLCLLLVKVLCSKK